MTRKAQKDDERHILKTLLKSLNMDGAEIVDSCDPPDFMIRHNEKKIAIEITEYHDNAQENGGSKKLAFESFWRKLQEKVNTVRSEQPKLDNLSVTLEFRQWEIKGLPLSKFIEAVVIFICEHQLSEDHHPNSNWLEAGQYFPIPDSNKILSPWLSRIHLYRSNCFMEWECNLLTADRVGCDQLLDTFNKKSNAKRPDDVDEFWLAIADGSLLSQTLHINAIERLTLNRPLNNALAKGPFDKVFLMGSKPGSRVTYQWTKNCSKKNDWREVFPSHH